MLTLSSSLCKNHLVSNWHILTFFNITRNISAISSAFIQRDYFWNFRFEFYSRCKNEIENKSFFYNNEKNEIDSYALVQKYIIRINLKIHQEQILTSLKTWFGCYKSYSFIQAKADQRRDPEFQQNLLINMVLTDIQQKSRDVYNSWMHLRSETVDHNCRLENCSKILRCQWFPHRDIRFCLTLN